MKKITLFIVLSILLLSIKSFAQQDAQYTQYMYNMNILNPAYAGSKDALSVGLLGRSQWVNIDGAPKTFTLSVHSPIGKKVGLGISAIVDKIGPVKEQNIFADFSYTVQASDKGKLAFGLKGGITIHNLNILSLTTINPENISLFDNENEIFPNFGAGVFYYSNTFYFGISLPNLLETRHFEKKNGVTTASERKHYFFTSGYVFDLSENLKFKPSIITKVATGSPISIDMSANFLINNKIDLGASYRLDDSISGLINFSVSKNFRIGYAYDYTLSNLGSLNSGSHEVMLLWDINFSQEEVVSPRYF